MLDYSKLYCSRGRIWKARSDYIVGIDNPFIRLQQLLNEKPSNELVDVDDIRIDRLAISGMLGSAHLVDVSSAEPTGYFFERYNRHCRLEGGKSLARKPVTSIEWSALRLDSLRDYKLAKEERRTSVTQIELEDNVLDLSTVYRRLIIPLSSDHGSEVTHLFVGAVRDLEERLPNSLNKEARFRFDAPEQNVARLMRERA
ncbi:hypothetical protein [Thalassobaculum litoreum]|uniref:Uncharacterized protein n=1 Tax=Thalassobaculum litoreum DSM 18839 TaxID=1123362 RepID=A0A8G2BHB1_9PROT|nr:hypothetical protein [Thalassobaculum litoreum]SDF69017.1 hypothetical protein SAMN05660686_02079 [Thalassobaculum litoreum DSM 18839]